MKDRIVIEANVHHGKPVIRGTRVPVVRLLGQRDSACGDCHQRRKEQC